MFIIWIRSSRLPPWPLSVTSDKKGSIGYALMNNIQKGNYPGKIFPINPKYATVNGLKAYPSIAEVGQSIDFAAIATPINTVPAIIGECVKAQMKGAIIDSAGGKGDFPLIL